MNVLSWSYAGGLLVVLIMLRWVGERSPLCGAALLLPPTLWLLPLAILIPAQFLWRPRHLVISVLAILGVTGVHMEPRWPHLPLSITPALTIVSSNLGQRDAASLRAFLERESVGLVALQDVGHNDHLALRRPEQPMYVAHYDRLLVLSRWPILNSGRVPNVSTPEGTAAAWFEVDCPAGRFVLYNVHMPTPRPIVGGLNGHSARRILRTVFHLLSRTGRNDLQTYFTQRHLLNQALLAHLEQERRPFIVAGDFNMSSHGYFARLFRSKMQDTFIARGHGFGYTFPGHTRNPLTLFGPWLRLDYIFASAQWSPIDASVEASNTPQHLAIVTKLSLRPDSTGKPPPTLPRVADLDPVNSPLAGRVDEPRKKF